MDTKLESLSRESLIKEVRALRKALQNQGPKRRLTYLSPKCGPAPSPIHGTGLFAREPISEGEIVGIKGGYILQLAEWQELETEMGSAEIQISQEFRIAPVSLEEREGSMLYSNHSCDPNIGIQGQIVFLAMRDIQDGEELTHDWATTDDEDYEMVCGCGSETCRGIVTGQDWRRPELQMKYQGWFAWHLQRKMEWEGRSGE